MEFLQSLAVSSDLYNYLLLPLLIFAARIGDVTFATLRVILLMQGKKVLAPALSFLESIIWLLAIGQIFNNLSDPLSYVAYAGGYAMGTYIGMLVEEKLALGRVVVRVITAVPAKEFIDYLDEKNYRYSNISATGNEGKVNIIFMVVKREVLPRLVPKIKYYHPKAFFTIEGVKKVSDEDLDLHQDKGIYFKKMLNLKRR